MAHSFTMVWIHAILGTKNRQSLIHPEYEKKLYSNIDSRLNELDCDLKIMNGTKDHIHLLFRINPKTSVAGVMKDIKGGSSHWINKQNFMKTKFIWQTGYGAFSVSESGLKDVIKYIKNQKEHHKEMTFQEEYDRFLKKYGFQTK